jgi:ribosomal protein S16
MNTYDVKPVQQIMLNPEEQEEDKEATLRKQKASNMMANTITPTKDSQKIAPHQGISDENQAQTNAQQQPQASST